MGSTGLLYHSFLKVLNQVSCQWWGLGSEVMEGMGKKEKGLMDVYKECGDFWREEGIRGPNSNGKAIQ